MKPAITPSPPRMKTRLMMTTWPILSCLHHDSSTIMASVGRHTMREPSEATVTTSRVLSTTLWWARNHSYGQHATLLNMLEVDLRMQANFISV